MNKRPYNSIVYMFDREIILGNSPFEYLQQYYLAEARAVGSIFGDAVDDIVSHIRSVMKRTHEYNPVISNQIDYSTSRRPFYIGWQFDADNKNVVYREKPIVEYHPIYLKYYLNPPYDFKFSIDDREDYNDPNDRIYINVNLENLKKFNTSDRQIRTSIIHELTHSLQMWVDAPGKIGDKERAYREFLNYDYLSGHGIRPDFVDINHLKIITIALMFLSDTECEAMCEEVEEYIRLYGQTDAMSTEYMTSETYLYDFLEKCSTHIFFAFKTAKNVLSKCHDIVNGIEYDNMQFKTLILLTSAMVDKHFINDTYHKEYAGYKQCRLLQENRFDMNYEIREKLSEAIQYLSDRLNGFAKNAIREIHNACKKYKIGKVLEKEDVHRLSKKQYQPVIYESTSPFLQRQRYQYQDYNELISYEHNTEQMEYLTESIRLLFENLFDENPWQIYGDALACGGIHKPGTPYM